MCVPAPAVMAAISLASTLAGTAMSVANAHQQAKQQNKMNEYNARVQENNAKSTMQQAELMNMQTQRKAREENKRTALMIGAQRAKAGASGAVVDSGSIFDTTLSLAEEGAKNSHGIMQQGDIDLWQMNLQAADMTGKAGMIRAQNQNPNAVLGEGVISGVGRMSDSLLSKREYFKKKDGSSLFG